MYIYYPTSYSRTREITNEKKTVGYTNHSSTTVLFLHNQMSNRLGIAGYLSIESSKKIYSDLETTDGVTTKSSSDSPIKNYVKLGASFSMLF